MKIIIACDSYKGSISSYEAAASIEKGIQRVSPNDKIEKVPIGDGGEGTCSALVAATNGHIVKKTVHGPLMENIESFYGILGDNKTAVIEIAAACGLSLIPTSLRNPMKTTSFGVGELILDALDRGCRKFIICLGGSGTNDGGCGMMKALGVSFKDSLGNEVEPICGILSKINDIDLSKMDKRIKGSMFTAACDVNNPLCGQNGASFVYGPQKGADPKMVIELDNNLKAYADTIKEKLNIDAAQIKGSGAAGGLGYAIFAFLNGSFKSGIDIVISETKLEEKLKNADLVITGEGKIDYQTAFGKAPAGIAALAKKYNIPVIAIAGSIGNNIDILYDKGFDSIFSITDKPMSIDDSMKNTKALLESTSERIMRLIRKFAK